ncbi:MAG: Peptidoglycan O-acetyltransferase [Candidatus Ordinivivax streblomastigis]|uniref:Peptidoglycan O-acetyltransferase n=1 Tax=Candidatus Ordinivivax streblomastigis TaxID=2540710 RepID=A0A5M8NZW6_9BACT|nr:MAG: Peptidoglycan O-acetyltransferase [Candidatus Ordinivivax streblomastigis]
MNNLFSFDANAPLLFTQFYFWAFFAIVFAGFTLLHNKILLRNAYLCFVSLFFYYKTSGLFVSLLIFTTICNYYSARWMFRSHHPVWKTIQLTFGLILNLFFLFYFKYAYFLTDMVNNLFGAQFIVFDAFADIGNLLGGKFDVSSILLPVGISFYTFQNISYLMDVFRKRIEPVKEILNFGFYVSFFPQLVAGPIVRASEFIPQLYKKYELTREQFGIAVFWILNGLAKKIILSDYIAVNFIDRVFDNPTMFSGFENLAALFGYSLQVYADFSGYTDIAIGVALLMGFHLPKNFNSPYKATNPGNFWKRWHISLSKWLQDYLYIPMGGNRKATVATYLLIVVIALIASILSGSLWVGGIILLLAVILIYTVWRRPEKKAKIDTNLNRMNTMLIGGLWHGASWNFMIWGGLNGIGLIVFTFWKDWNIAVRTVTLTVLTVLFFLLSILTPMPLFTIGLVWSVILLFGTTIRFLYSILGGHYAFKYTEMAWAVFQTFVFISFTRLFFRSGSNLNPAEANQTAWKTAKDMVNQIGGQWDFSQIADMIQGYRSVFALIVIGMIIHWLPENFKQKYRHCFAKIPLVPMALVVVIAVFIIYQFITADLQPFIYFQF